MSQENVEAARGVRTPVVISTENSRRTLDENVLVRFPALARLLMRALMHLPPRSRPRRTILSRIVRQVNEAANRRDFEFVLLAFDPSFEFRYDEVPDLAFPDLLGVIRGHEGFRRAWEAAEEAWDGLRFEPDEVIDFGDRLLVSSRATGHGRSTGIRLDQPMFQVFTLRNGLIIQQLDFADFDKALEAAGLSE